MRIPIHDLKKLPKGSEIAGSYDQLSIWGDRMALVDAPYYDTTSSHDFDRYNLAIRYRVYLSDIPVEARLFREPVDFARGDVPMYETSFTYRPSHGIGKHRGHVEAPIDYWVDITKFKDLGSSQAAAVTRTLEEKGYKEQDVNRPLSAAKWRKLLALSFQETQEGDSDLANAAYAVVSGGPWGPTMSEEEEIRVWDNLPGVFATTKKGAIKFIISRNPSGRGI